MEIQEYRDGDRSTLIRFMEELQDHVAALDPLKRVVRRGGYGAAYTDRLLQKIANCAGKVFIAEDAGEIIGCIAGTIAQQDSVDRLGSVVTTTGIVEELFVSDRARGRGVGAQLMKRLETYFTEGGCDALYVEVFAPNSSAQKFYEREGYGVRSMHLLKKLR